MSPNAIRWDQKNRERYGEEMNLRYKINQRFDRLAELESEIKNYYYKDKYLLMASRLLEFKKHLRSIVDYMKKKDCLIYDYTSRLERYTKKYEVFKNLE